MNTIARILTATTTLLLAVPLTMGAANAATLDETTPVTVATDLVPAADPPTQAPVQEVQEDSPMLGTPLPASVTIVSAPDTWMPVVPYPMILATTGFSEGNWVNVWVTDPDGTRHSQDGHFMRNEKNPKAFANFLAGKGEYKVQVNVGK